ncbi:E3 ubiquitin-protein ligase BRE1-like 1 [Silene latifolia]|uniref:E3 ubiquitin-protein ligase BRE1-like 1 n=1 Tax=Silene latifolia TaxID=37657 RepID=UPI003D771C40
MANEADRKRRHVSSISPTAAVAMAKKQGFCPLSEDKKLDAAVLQFQNQKLSQKLEAQKLEISALETKLSQRRDKQQRYDRVLTTVDNRWEKIVDDLEPQSTHIKGLVSREEKADHSANSSDDMFLQRLMETSTAESCLASGSLDQMMEEGHKACEKSRSIMHNAVSAVDDVWLMKHGFDAAESSSLPRDDCRQEEFSDLLTEIENMQSTVRDHLVKQTSLEKELKKHQEIDLKNKAELKHLRGELESTTLELEDCNQKLGALKAEKDATKGAFFPVLNLGNKHPGNDRAADNQKDLLEMESKLKESMAHSSSRLQELELLHKERAEILKKLSSLQGTLKNLTSISSAKAFKLVKEELEKSKSDFIHCQALYEKLQVEKDKVLWKERDAVVRNDLGDAFRRTLTTAGSRIHELEADIRRLKDQRKRIEAMLQEASREPGRKEIISNFREFVSSFPEDMSSMQSNLRKYKDTASDVHSLRAELQSFLNIHGRKAKELVTLSSRSVDQDAEMRSLQAVVADLKETDSELKLFAEMFRRESVLPRNLSEARDKEYQAWARVHSLKFSLDEHNMESRVKTAIEAEALSQRRLAAAEAEIADLREKYESSKRNKSKLSTDLKCKQDENAAYLSEIETIGQAYDDMQNQNQQLLKQITERDDYNIKLGLEGLQGKQTHDSLLEEKHVLEKKIQQANVSQNLFEVKAGRIEDQVKSSADQIHRLAEDRCRNTIALENIRRRTLEARKSSQQARESLDLLQLQAKNSRVNFSGFQIELERERFEKKRLEEELEAVKRKAEHLKAQKEGSVVGKLEIELQEYKEILKCSICLDRPKEVVITKCYHLLCNPCVQKVLKTRHRKCPVCAASFGPNDVKPVYI